MALTSISGRLFENALREMVATMTWHNKYLGDKYDKESKYVDAVEVDTYLTGARHLLMSHIKSELETVEDMTEAEYIAYRYRIYKTETITDEYGNTTELRTNKELPYWDMFYYGQKLSYDLDDQGNYVVNDKTVLGLKQYEEKNTYYREIYGLPEYNGTSFYCYRCRYTGSPVSVEIVCPKCGASGEYVDRKHSAPCDYSHIAKFPIYTDKIVNTVWDPNSSIEYNPLDYLYNQPLRLRLYAEFSTTFVKDIQARTKNDSHYKYLYHMTYAKVHPFVARLSDRFEILYIQDADIDVLTDDFKTIYEECRLFMKYRYYTEAFRNQYTEYEGFIGLAILFMALQRMQAKYLETDITRDFYDLESIEVIYNAYSVPFYEDIPITYHTKIIKAINRLISKKGSNECFKDIFSIFGYSTLNMYQYYILKTHKQTADGTRKPMYYVDENGNQVPEKMYDVKIVKADIGENPYTYIIDSLNYMDYYGVTEPDTYWINDDDLLYKLYHSEYNFLETKYIGIEMVFKLTRFTIETEYIMRMLLDNKDSGNNGTNKLMIYHNRIGRDIDVYTLVIYIMYIIGKQFGLKNGGNLDLLRDPTKLSSIYGFNFIEDLTMVYGYLSRNFIYNYKPGYTYTEQSINPNASEYIYFVDADYSELSESDLYNRDNIIHTGDIIYDDMTTHMLKESILNKLDIDGDNYSGFMQYINDTMISKFPVGGDYAEYIDIFTPRIYTRDPNNPDNVYIDNKNPLYNLVFAFNTMQRLLNSYTEEESKMKNLLDFKFVKVYYSDDVCAYCGFPRYDIHNMYTYCHNTNCFSNHFYEDDVIIDDEGHIIYNGYGPLLVDVRDRIPKTQKITEEMGKYRNQVYAEFVNNYELINPYLVEIIRIFNTYPIDLIDVIDSRTYTIHIDHNDTNILLISEDISVITPGAYITVTTTDGDTIKVRTIGNLADTIDIEQGGVIVTYNQILLNKNITCDINSSVTIKYRNAHVTFDTWCTMMEYGFNEKRLYFTSNEEYEEMMEAVAKDPSAYTVEELEAKLAEVEYHKQNYTHSLYYIMGILSEFVNSEDDIDLGDTEKYTWVNQKTIKDILVDNNMYDALIGLRTKREFRLFISNQLKSQKAKTGNPYLDLINEMSDQVTDPSNVYAKYIPRLAWIRLYLNYYFLDREKTQSVLVDTMDKYFLYDRDRFIGSAHYGHEDTSNRTGVAYSYMNDTLPQEYNRGSNSHTNVFDYITSHIRAIIDADTNISTEYNDYELNIGIGRAVDKDWNKLRSSYNAIAELQEEFTKLTWGIKNPKAYHAVKRLNKMLMTTYYAKRIYQLGDEVDSDGSPKTASSYRELLEYLNPLLPLRIDNMTEKQRLAELEYSLARLDKISDDLIYLHAYGGINMKKIISYIWNLLYFFKSAKVDLLHYAIEFRVDDKTDNLIKYMTELTKLNTESSVTPDQWRLTDIVSIHEINTRLNIDKSIDINFADTFTNISDMKTVFSSIYFADQISGHSSSQVNAVEIFNVLHDYLKPDINLNFIGRNDNWKIPLELSSNISDKDNFVITKLRNYIDNDIISMPYINTNNEDLEKITFDDNLQLSQRIVYELDTDAPYTIDEYGNHIYPYKEDQYGNQVYHIFDNDDDYYEWIRNRS